MRINKFSETKDNKNSSTPIPLSEYSSSMFVYTGFPNRRSVSLQPTRSRGRGWIQIQLLPLYMYLNLPPYTPPPSPPLNLPISTRAGLSNGHYGNGPRGPCALGAQERGNNFFRCVFTLSANSALVGKRYLQ